MTHPRFYMTVMESEKRCVRIPVVTHRCMPFMVIPSPKNYELNGIEGYTCQTQAKTHTIVSRTHRSEKQDKQKTIFLKSKGVI